MVGQQEVVMNERRKDEMTLSEVANRVIEHARKVHNYYDTELRKRYPHYPLIYPGEEDEESVPPPPEEIALKDFLGSLSEEMLYQLVLIMDLGRQQVETDNLAGYYESLRGEGSHPEYAVSQLMNSGPLAEVLADGLDELRKHHLNVDKLPLKKPKARKR
jgi:hypothetical protein